MMHVYKVADERMPKEEMPLFWANRKRESMLQYVVVPETCIAILGDELRIDRDHAEYLYLSTPLRCDDKS